MIAIAIVLVIGGVILAWHGPTDLAYIEDWLCWIGALSMVYVGLRILWS